MAKIDVLCYKKGRTANLEGEILIVRSFSSLSKELLFSIAKWKDDKQVYIYMGTIPFYFGLHIFANLIFNFYKDIH